MARIVSEESISSEALTALMQEFSSVPVQPEYEEDDEIEEDDEEVEEDIAEDEEEEDDGIVVLTSSPDDNDGSIPLNSPTLLISETTSRFSSAEWFDKMREVQCSVAGLGGIGSWTALLISRLNPRYLALYDIDRVEIVNMSGQLYRTNHVGMLKTVACSNQIHDHSRYYGCNSYGDIRDNPITTPIVIGGFDNMEARKTLFHKWKSYVGWKPEDKKCECLFIDGRLNAEEFQIFCFTGEDEYLMDKYEKQWLFDDSEAEETICSYKQTSYCASMIASVITNLVVNFVTNQCDPVIPRELPFFTRYDSATMMLRTEM